MTRILSRSIAAERGVSARPRFIGGLGIGVDSKMPTVLRVAGYRFFLFSNERQEPAHIHVEHGASHAKFWLASATLAGSQGFRSAELSELRRLVEANRPLFQERWHEFFSR